jgi:IS30 family transposase
MARVRWTRLTWNQKAELWQRWRRGESLSQIARALDRVPGAIFTTLAARGGISPAPRRRSRLALTTTEREEISRDVARGISVRAISRLLKRAPSTISRELRRERHAIGPVRPIAAPGRVAGAKRCRLATRPSTGRRRRKLAAKWSPQQIAGWLRQTFPGDPDMQVSHETIYRSLFDRAGAC